MYIVDVLQDTVERTCLVAGKTDSDWLKYYHGKMDGSRILHKIAGKAKLGNFCCRANIHRN